jgi:hypothetical protein
MKWHVLGALAPALLLAGCASRMSVEQYRAYLADPSAPLVIVQACLPGRTASFDEIEVDVTGVPGDLAYASQQAYGDLALKAEALKELPGAGITARETVVVRHWRGTSAPTDAGRDIQLLQVDNDGAVASAGGGSLYLADATDAGEPVYEGSTNRRAGTVIAVGVRTHDNSPAQRKANWFRPPPEIPRGPFTPWLKPDYVAPESASQSVQWLLLNGKPLPAGESVAQDAPRVRFAVLTWSEYNARVGKDRLRASRSLQLARLAGAPGALPEVRHVIRARQGPVPPCR